MYNDNKYEYPDTDVWYEVLDEDNNSLFHHRGVSCFSSLTYNSFDGVEKSRNNIKPIRYIDFYFPDNKTPYDSEFIKDYCKVVTELGFPMEYSKKGVKSIIHHILIDVNKLDDKRIMLTSTLIIARYLYEDGLEIIPAAMFDLIEKGVDPFIALQKAHNMCYCRKYLFCRYMGNTNHSLIGFYELQEENDKDDFLFTKEEFFNKVKESKVTIRKDSSINTSGFWHKTINYKSKINR